MLLAGGREAGGGGGRRGGRGGRGGGLRRLIAHSEVIYWASTGGDLGRERSLRCKLAKLKTNIVNAIQLD